MQQRPSFHQIATALATLGAQSLVAGDLAAAPASDPIVAHEVPHAVALGEGDTGDDDKEKDKDKDRGNDEGDDAGDAGDKKKKKKGKKEGSCGGHGGCGAGGCG